MTARRAPGRAAGLRLAALALLLPALAAGEERYLCVVGESVGFKFIPSTLEWQKAVFETDVRYVVAKPEDTPWYEVSETGNPDPFALCRTGFSEDGLLTCNLGSDSVFKMNRETGRFLNAYLIGYYDAESPEQSADTPLIEIGTCAPF